MADHAYVGTVIDLPSDIDFRINELFNGLGLERQDRKRRSLAGPNDIIQFILSSQYLVEFIPWAVSVFVTNELFRGSAILIDKFRNRKNNKTDDLSVKIDELFRVNEGVNDRLSGLPYKIDVLIDRMKFSNPPYHNGWEPSFAIRGSNVVEARETVYMPAFIQEFGHSVPDRNAAALAVLCLNVLASEIEDVVESFLGEVNLEDSVKQYRTVEGVPEINDDGSIEVTLKLSMYGSNPRYVKISYDSNGMLYRSP